MKQAKVLNDAELKRLLAIVDANRYAARNRLAIMLSNLAGMRVGEIAHLTIGDVFQPDDQIREQITLDAAYTKNSESRSIYVSKRLHKEIARYAKTRTTRMEASRPLLITQKGGAFSPNTLCQLFMALFRKAGIDGASSHSGRRAFITTLAHSGISPKVIMTLAGHKHLSTTQRYIDVNDELLKAAVEVI